MKLWLHHYEYAYVTEASVERYIRDFIWQWEHAIERDTITDIDVPNDGKYIQVSYECPCEDNSSCEDEVLYIEFERIDVIHIPTLDDRVAWMTARIRSAK